MKPSVTKLNGELLKKQNVSPENELELELVYEKLSHVIAFPEEYEDPVKLIEGLELKLQFLWDFPQDTRYHRYWKAIKGCACAFHQMDNWDRFGTPYRVVNSGCPWHGVEQ